MSTDLKMSKEIVFETINVEDPIQKSKVQFEAKIYKMVNGKQIYADEETGFIHQKYSGFAPKKYNPDPLKRDFIRIQYDPVQKACMELKKDIDDYDDAFELNRKTIFGKYDRLYKFGRSVKQPKTNEEDELSEDDEDDEKPNKEIKEVTPKYETSKFKLKMDWYYYYEGERLDKINTSIVKKTVSDIIKKNKNLDKDKRKLLLSSLSFKLEFKEENKMIQKEVKMDDLEQKKEIAAMVFYRRPKEILEGAEEFLKTTRGNSEKDINDYETNLIKFFGDPHEPKDVRTPDDLDKFYNYNCYIRILYSPLSVWAAKTKEPDADKRKCGIKYIINSIDIIQLPYENNSNSYQKLVYSKYAFGKINNTSQILINQNVDNVFTAIEDDSNVVEKNKIKMKIKIESEESEDTKESEDSDDSDDSESEESSDDSESEDEKHKPIKNTKGKTIVENTKNIKNNKKIK